MASVTPMMRRRLCERAHTLVSRTLLTKTSSSLVARWTRRAVGWCLAMLKPEVEAGRSRREKRCKAVENSRFGEVGQRGLCLAAMTPDSLHRERSCGGAHGSEIMAGSGDAGPRTGHSRVWGARS